MVGLIAEVSVQQLVALRRNGILARRLNSDEHRIDLAQHLRIVRPKDPALLRLVIGIEDAETFSPLPWSFFLAPYAIVVAGILDAVIVQVVRIKDQRLSFGEENSSEGRTCFPFGVRVEDIG